MHRSLLLSLLLLVGAVPAIGGGIEIGSPWKFQAGVQSVRPIFSNVGRPVVHGRQVRPSLWVNGTPATLVEGALRVDAIRWVALDGEVLEERFSAPVDLLGAVLIAPEGEWVEVELSVVEPSEIWVEGARAPARVGVEAWSVVLEAPSTAGELLVLDLELGGGVAEGALVRGGG